MNPGTLAKQLQYASVTQRALLPQEFPRAPGYEFFACCERAEPVGGDFYDCLMLPDDKVCFTFGDVPGRGIPAALVMSRLSGVVRATLEFVHEPGEAVSRINSQMARNGEEHRFVTFVLGVIDLRCHELSLVLAGHMSPMFRKADGSIEEFPFSASGLPLGVIADLEFETIRRPIEMGETVVIYSDGLCDAMDSSGTLYGMDRFRKMVSEHGCRPPLLGRAILDDVQRHVAGGRHPDDLTIMVIGRSPQAAQST